jgi:signal transduction histidine kinase
LKKYVSKKPDCVLLDYKLPDLNGLEFLNNLSSRKPEHAAPVIMLTGEGSEELVVEALRSGAVDYVPKKVVSNRSLTRAITNAVEKHELRTAVEHKQRKLEKTNKELLRKHDEIQRFYHTLSHELKTPLTGACEFVSIVLDGLSGPLNETQTEYLGLAKEACDQMTRGLNDLLDATRLDTGKLHISPQRCSIDTLVSRIVMSMKPLAERKGISLDDEISHDLPDVYIDEQRITQVLTNLLTNAFKFTENGGEVSVKVGDSADTSESVLISVVDTGRGIEADQLPHIFDRLYQVTRSDSHGEGGLGLGLNICKELVVLHKGNLWVESTPGAGSTFSFNIRKFIETESEYS